MKATTVIWVCIGVLCSLVPLHSAPANPTYNVQRPTILAFFPPVTDAELKVDPATDTALDDFQTYARKVREPLEKRGIELREVYATAFTVQVDKSATGFKPGKVKVGYYFIAPGRKPRIHYGVMTDVDLLHVADEYFGKPGPN